MAVSAGRYFFSLLSDWWLGLVLAHADNLGHIFDLGRWEPHLATSSDDSGTAAFVGAWAPHRASYWFLPWHPESRVLFAQHPVNTAHTCRQLGPLLISVPAQAAPFWSLWPGNFALKKNAGTREMAQSEKCLPKKPWRPDCRFLEPV